MVLHNWGVNAWTESDLAWELAEAVAPLMPEADRAAVYATIGAGNSFTAISSLLEASVDLSCVLSAELLSHLGNWRDAYVNDDGATRLHRLLEEAGEIRTRVQ